MKPSQRLALRVAERRQERSEAQSAAKRREGMDPSLRAAMEKVFFMPSFDHGVDADLFQMFHIFEPEGLPERLKGWRTYPVGGYDAKDDGRAL